MGQKIHPNGLRVGFFRKWNNTWFVEKEAYNSLFFAQQYLEHFLKTFFHFYSYTKNSATKKVLLVDLKWFLAGNTQLYFFVFFYKLRTKKRRWGFFTHNKRKINLSLLEKKNPYFQHKVNAVAIKLKNRLKSLK